MKRRKQAAKPVACKKKWFRFSDDTERCEPAYFPETDIPEVVKGTSRRVVVVHPEETLFEQIIYVVRDDALTQPGVSEAEVLYQAATAVEPHFKEMQKRKKTHSRLTVALLWLSGIALTLAVGIGVYWYLAI